MKKRKVLNKLLSALLVFVICFTAAFGTTNFVSAASADYSIAGVNVRYEPNGTLSVNVHIANPTDNEKLLISKTGGDTTFPSVDVLTDSYYAGTDALPADAKMYTISNISVTDLDSTLTLTREVDGAQYDTKEFSVYDYADKVIKGENVYYTEATSPAQIAADKAIAAAFVNYVVHAANSLAAQNGNPASSAVSSAVEAQLNSPVLDASNTQILESYNSFSSTATFNANTATNADDKLKLAGIGLNLKDNPYLLVTFAISGDYANNKAAIKASFTVGDQTITFSGDQMTKNGGNYLVRAKGIDIKNLCKAISLDVTYNNSSVLTGELGVEGFVAAAMAAAEQNSAYQNHINAGKALIYYSKVINARNSLFVETKEDEEGKTAFAIYSADDSSLRFYYDFKPTGDTYNDLTVTELYEDIETTEYTNETTPAVMPDWVSNTTESERYKKIVFHGGKANGNPRKIWPISMAYWFSKCANVTSIEGMAEWLNTSDVTTMHLTFNQCGKNSTSPLRIDVSNFNTSKVTSMKNMFYNCKSTTELDVTGFDTRKVTDMSSMFDSCTNLTELDLSSFDTTSLTKIGSMFNGSSNLKTIFVSDKFVINSSLRSNTIFRNCNSLVGGSGTKFDSKNITAAYAIIDGTNGNKGYFTAKQ